MSQMETLLEKYVSADLFNEVGGVKNKITILSFLLHFSDFSFATRNWDICKIFGYKKTMEFFLEGDKCRKLELPVLDIYDRNRCNSDKINESLIGMIVLPL